MRGSQAAQYKQVGNAVPVLMQKRVEVFEQKFRFRAFIVNGELTAMVMFRSTGGSYWEQLIGQGHDQYWTIRQYASSNQMTMHVMNSNDPRASFSQHTDYVVVGRVAGGYRDVKIYATDGSLHAETAPPAHQHSR